MSNSSRISKYTSKERAAYECLSTEQRKQVDEWLAKMEVERMEADKAAAVTQKAADKVVAQK